MTGVTGIKMIKGGGYNVKLYCFIVVPMLMLMKANLSRGMVLLMM